MKPFTDIHDELIWRGSLYDATAGAEQILKTEKVSCYNGFDPTSSTLHIGNLLPLMCLARMQKYGHTPIAILGGGTGLIGDPSGRIEERALMSIEQIEANAEAIRIQLSQFLDFESKTNPAKLINNADWLCTTNLIDFLRDVGKHFTVNTMTKRESVQGRIDREDGISFTEFSYQLLQALDFLVLYEREGCTFQSGGSDQWGNILGGVDLIRRTHGTRADGFSLAHAIVFPLIVDSKGDKLGKSIGGAPALDPKIFSPYRLYQFFYNTDDSDVIRYLKLYTWLKPEEIVPLETAVQDEPAKREAQRTLAQEVTHTVHSQNGLEQALRVTRAFFKGSFDELSADELEDVFDGAQSIQITKHQIENSTFNFEQLALESSLVSSIGEARRTTQQGGMYLNSERVQTADRPITIQDMLHGKMIIIRRGRREHRLIRIIN